MNSNTKVAIVTGAGSGIGKWTALAFLKKGYAVALAGRRKSALETTAADSGSSGSRALVVPTDVGDPDAVHRIGAGMVRASAGLTAVWKICPNRAVG